MHVVDCHVHLNGEVPETDLTSFVQGAKIDKLHLISRNPYGEGKKAREYIQELAGLHSALAQIIVPVAWIDPLHRRSPEIAEWAVRECGMQGIKLIPRGWFPYDACAREIYAVADEMGAFIQFHSGILWQPGDNSRFCRPALFEAMWDYPGVRFSLAHIGWPWCDECIAVVQKVNHMRPENDQAFVDLAPGTPPIYRRQALQRCLALVGPDHMWFGSDSGLPTQSVLQGSWACDEELLRKLDVTEEDRHKILFDDARRFMSGKEDLGLC